MSNDLSFPAAPNLPTEASDESVGRKTLEAHYYTHMSETEARARSDVAKNTYAVPARQETYRFFGALILAGILLYFFVPAFLATNPDKVTLAWVIVAIVGVVATGPAVKAAIDALKGR